MVKTTTYKISLKERFLEFLERNLDKLLVIPAFQRYVNRKANNRYGSTFITHHWNAEIDDVFIQYKFYDIQLTDIVLDIGANVGAFSLFVSKFTKRVFAVEPMLYNILNVNIFKNDRRNVFALPYALGEGTINISWEGCKNKLIEGKSLKELINICGGHVDFLKCD